jgi:hypothetical protein
MIKLIKPKFNIITKEYTSAAKIKLNIKHEFSPDEALKLASRLTQLAESATKLNHTIFKGVKHDPL